MFWLKKKIASFRQYFSSITSQDSFKNKFNFVYKYLSSSVPSGIISTLIIDICYSFLKNRYWYSSSLFRQIMISKISKEYNLSSDLAENLFDEFLFFFDTELKEYKYDSGVQNESESGTDTDTDTQLGSDYNFIKYICVKILATSDLDLDKDENYNVNELGVGKDILDKVKSISVHCSDILDNSSKFFLSDLDKNILLSLEEIALGVDKNPYYIDIEVLSYELMDYFCANKIDRSKIFSISTSVFNMLEVFSEHKIYSLPRGSSLYDKFSSFSRDLSIKELDSLVDFMLEENLIYRKASGIATKFSLSSQAQNIVSSAFCDYFFKTQFGINDILKLEGAYQVKVLARLKDTHRSMFVEIFSKHLSELSALSLQVCCKYMNQIKEECGLNSDDIIDKISFLKSGSLNGINVAIYDRISTIVSDS